MNIFILWVRITGVFPVAGVFSTFEKALKGAERYRTESIKQAESIKQELPIDCWRKLEIIETKLNDTEGAGWIKSTSVYFEGEKAITWHDTFKPTPRPEWLINFEEHREELGFGPPES